MARTRPPFADKSVLESLEQTARELRFDLVSLYGRIKRPLPGGALSCIETLVALYWKCLRVDPKHPDNPGRDRFIFNKSQLFSALYVVLARRGFFPAEELEHFNEAGCRLAQQPAPASVPGVEWTNNAPGHGLGVGMGMALAAQVQAKGFHTYVLLDEIESQEGAIWEAAQLAPRLSLGNLTAIIETHSKPAERPKTAKTSVMTKWQSLGWTVRETDGHDLNTIVETLQARRPESTPLAVIVQTTKGKGISLIENNSDQDRPLTTDEIESARKELGL